MEEKNAAPTTEQWEKLFEVASKIKIQAPWTKLWDNDLVTIMLPGHKEPVYISVMGRNGECYGIGVYPGYRSITGFYRLLDSTADNVNMLGFQNCLMCYFGNRDELAPEEREIIKALGLKFRGENNWIYFRTMEEGYYPWFINAGQADLLIEALQNFAMAYIHFSSGRVQVDFEGGETLIREYSPERKEWLNAAIPMPPVPLISVEQSFKDELLLQRLKNKAKNNNLLEMDILYLPVPVKDKSDERPYFPRVLVLLDQKNGIILDHKMLNVKMKNEEAATDMLIGYIKQHGRPGKLFVRDQYFLCYIESLCSPLNIPIAYGVPAIDRFAEETINMMDKL